MARAMVDASGIKKFARQMRTIDRKLGVATSAELRAIGNRERDKIRNSNESPAAENPADDSKNVTRRKRRSVKVSVRAGGVSLYSREPDAGVWNWGGSIKPNGVSIQIPRTEFVSGQVKHDAKEIEADLLGLLSGIASRYGEFV